MHDYDSGTMISYAESLLENVYGNMAHAETTL